MVKGEGIEQHKLWRHDSAQNLEWDVSYASITGGNYTYKIPLEISHMLLSLMFVCVQPSLILYGEWPEEIMAVVSCVAI